MRMETDPWSSNTNTGIAVLVILIVTAAKSVLNKTFFEFVCDVFWTT